MKKRKKSNFTVFNFSEKFNLDNRKIIVNFNSLQIKQKINKTFMLFCQKFAFILFYSYLNYIKFDNEYIICYVYYFQTINRWF